MESIVAAPLAATESSALATLINVVIAIAVLVGPFVIGAFLANGLRMRDYGWRFGLILCAISASCWVLWSIWDPVTKQFNFKLGVDLQGGVILIYEVEHSVKIKTETFTKRRGVAPPTDTSSTDFSMPALIEALSRRINPAGTKEIVIRPYGERSVEIIIPEVDQREVDHIKKVISTAGVLQFRIVANARDHKYIIDLARENALDPIKKRGRIITDASGADVGLWARVGRETKEFSGVKPFKVAVGEFTLRDSVTGDLLQVPPDVVNNMADETDDARRLRLAKYIAERGIKEIDVLMETDDGQNVTGAHLGAVMKSVDELMNPCIHFNLRAEGAGLFGELTGHFAPTEDGFKRQLGIVLDNELLSAPNIQERITDRGRITGRFTDEEVQFLVNILQAGSLPVVLNKDPISSSMISPLLGQETINQGKVAMVLGMSLVFIFMTIYYRFSGFLACVVLALNLLFTLALIVLIKAPLTLPGLAGLVLTIGMAVDSNVLIYERMREELARGGALRMVIRNGFNRATTTIVDSNLTTVLTAIVLYLIGTDQLRGFAVTLTLGLITSMFTAIFCSRVFFDIVERTRFMTTLKMFQFVGVTNFDFLSVRHVAVVGSLIAILIGFVALGVRRSDALDIDFTGGSSVHVMLEQEVESDQVRKVLDAKFSSMKIPYTLTGMSVTPGDTTNDIFKVDAKIEDAEVLEKTIQEAFQQSGSSLTLKTNPLQFSELRETVVSTTPPKTESPAAPSSDQKKADDKKADEKKVDEKKVDEKKVDEKKVDEKKVDEKESGDKSTDEKESGDKSTDEKKADEKKADEKKTDEKKTDEKKETGEDKGADKKGESTPADSKTGSTDDKKSPTESEKTSSEKTSAEKASDATPKAEEGAAIELPSKTLLALAAQETKSEEKAAAAADQPKSDKEAQAAAEKSAPAPAAPQKADEPAKTEQPKTDAAAKGAAEPKSIPETKTDAAPPASPAGTPPAASPAPTPAPTAATSAPPASGTLIESTLTFTEGVNAATVSAEIETAAQELNIPLSYFDVDTEGWDRSSSNVFKTWNVKLSTTKDNAQKLLERLQKKFTEQPVWPSSNKIGPTVAGKLTRMAIMALIASWLGIIVYVWIRFQNLVFGLAAVIALVHDVLITVAALAVSKWLAGPLGFLLVEDFKISLTIVAALLTIIGYSINDTIVIFDRIREIKGKSADVTQDMVNLSLNQTLSRTILTFFTTFLTVICLYGLGGPGIHGFAFAMVIGMITGTYSTVFIATPFVLWLAGKSIERKPTVPSETTRVQPRV